MSTQEETVETTEGEKPDFSGTLARDYAVGMISAAIDPEAKAGELIAFHTYADCILKASYGLSQDDPGVGPTLDDRYCIAFLTLAHLIAERPRDAKRVAKYLNEHVISSEMKRLSKELRPLYGDVRKVAANPNNALALAESVNQLAAELLENEENPDA